MAVKVNKASAVHHGDPQTPESSQIPELETTVEKAKTICSGMAYDIRILEDRRAEWKSLVDAIRVAAAGVERHMGEVPEQIRNVASPLPDVEAAEKSLPDELQSLLRSVKVRLNEDMKTADGIANRRAAVHQVVTDLVELAIKVESLVENLAPTYEGLVDSCSCSKQ